MPDNGDANASVNQIVSAALQKMGVQQRDIHLPSESVVEEPSKVPTQDGKPKGSVFGVLPVEDSEPEVDEETTPKPKQDEPVVQPLTKADIEATFDKAISRLQSIVDKKINNLQLQMQQTVGTLNTFLQSQEEADIANLPEGDQFKRRLERLEKGGAKLQIPQVQIEQQPAKFYQYLTNFVDAVGLKIDDKRINWAPNESNPETGFNTFLTSVKAALLEDQTKTLNEIKTSSEREVQKLRKKTGVDRVSTSGPAGAANLDVDKMTPMQKLEYAFAQQAQQK